MKNYKFNQVNGIKKYRSKNQRKDNQSQIKCYQQVIRLQKLMYKQIKPWVYTFEIPKINNKNGVKSQGISPRFMSIESRLKKGENSGSKQLQLDQYFSTILVQKLRRKNPQTVQCPRNVMYQSINITRKANRSRQYNNSTLSSIEQYNAKKNQQHLSLQPIETDKRKQKQFASSNYYQNNLKNKKRLNESYWPHRVKQHSLIRAITNLSKFSQYEKEENQKGSENSQIEPSLRVKKNEIRIIKLQNKKFNF